MVSHYDYTNHNCMSWGMCWWWIRIRVTGNKNESNCLQK